ncbi:secA translation cis-regulator SecM [Acerihabitans sp. TG2]|uniref:secA translation cis-regulator SecM n=1 Tax=Acerihabitans sp. TG2 TaxID=3096008 RepID=UPI002B22D9C4|nr:secA translation cis-regulator SecM [Acerihabitans sp. TG2]MEA9391791.1 secA translation cis-regulator SecM [Acerihabitans sp. TG2]
MGILNRWRQFGRRYFWPHLLLGMVAAGFGVPYMLNNGQEQAHLANALPSLSRQNAFNAGFDRLALLKDVQRRPSFSVDYWHQHAIRTVIRHLSAAWAPQHLSPQLTSAEIVTPLKAQHQVLLRTLNALLTLESRPAAVVRQVAHVDYRSTIDHRTGIRLTQVQGIRAGPAHIG